jgi:hypothetical protein
MMKIFRSAVLGRVLAEKECIQAFIPLSEEMGFLQISGYGFLAGEKLVLWRNFVDK